MTDIIVCILNKNDAKNLKLNKKKILNIIRNFNVILVDSNSTDESYEFAKSIGLEIFNVGSLSRGESISECIKKYRRQYKYIIFTSSDGEENYDDLSKFLPLFISGADMVIASRLAKGGYFKSDQDFLWYHRKLYLIFITSIINYLFKGKITDCWNGYRGFNLQCFDKINIIEKNYLVEAETTIKFLKNGLVIKEFPTTENPRKFGKSSNNIIKSGFGHIILIIKNLFN